MRKSKVLFVFFMSGVILASGLNAFAQYVELIGKEVQLQTFQGKQPICVGTGKKMYNLLTGNLMGVNKQDYLITILRHKGFEVENDTRARILEINYWEKTAKVEILDGARAGWVGWVLLEQAIGY
ncbi:MAG: hypothetical protein Q8O30_12655 [Candidatus Omnitrophota bacterium]|nr:hypothetical protein [Candidatus Omnitrophota bacterium]